MLTSVLQPGSAASHAVGPEPLPLALLLLAPQPATFGWSMEKIGGGGFVTGITISPDGLTRLVRTDVGGGCRWDTTTDLWQPLITEASMPPGDTGTVPYFGDGVHAIAAANSVAFMAYNGNVYKTTDRGLTWVNVKTGIPTAPNANSQRWWNHHLVIDPSNPARVLYGSFSTGVWFTLNGGTTWTQVPATAVPWGSSDVNGPMGIPVVGIHPTTGDLWACPYGQGIYKSTDSGATWIKTTVDTMFTTGCGLAFTSDGNILATGIVDSTNSNATNSNIYRYASGAWSAIALTGSPSGNRRWRSIAADPTTPGRVMIQADSGYTKLSTNNGTAWSYPTISWNDTDSDVDWLPAANGGSQSFTTFFTTIGGLQFDPQAAGRVWLTQGIGVWYADLPATLTGLIPWTTRTRGLEEMVVNDVLAPPAGHPLAVCWDRPIFGLREAGDAYPTHYHPTNGAFSSAWQADYSADDPTRVVAQVANHQNNGVGTPAQTGYSADGGHTWTPFPAIPLNSTNATSTFGFGSVHVSGDHVIWVGNNSHGAYRSPDLGSTWTKITIAGVADSAWNQKPYFVLRQSVAAEKTAGHQGTFYAYILNQGVYRTLDGGATWTQRSTQTPFNLYAGTTWDWHVRLKAVPDNPGHLFITSGRLGSASSPVTTTPLLRSSDGGTTWVDTGMRQVSAFDFGAPPPGETYPAVYAYGVGGTGLGLYRSVDGGLNWTMLDPAPVIKAINGVAASKDTYGLVWLGTGGQGVARGEYT